MGTLTLSLDEVVKGFPLNIFEVCLKLTKVPETLSASFGEDGSLSSPENPKEKPNVVLQQNIEHFGQKIIFPWENNGYHRYSIFSEKIIQWKISQLDIFFNYYF